MNLSTLHPPITHEGVVTAVADKFYQVHGVTEQHKVTNNYLSPNVCGLLCCCCCCLVRGGGS